MRKFVLIWALLAGYGVVGQEDDSLVFREGNDIMWCCLSKEELLKCQAFAEAAKKDHEENEYTFGSYYRYATAT